MNSLDRLISILSRLPGIGKKSATRIAYSLLVSDRVFVENLGNLIRELPEKIVRCSLCGNYTEEDPCSICSSSERNRKQICIVEQPRDAQIIDATGEYKGLFFVLNGVISPLDGIGPEQLGLNRLKERVDREGITEMIIATNPTVEGDTTSLYLQRLFQGSPVRLSRIATGLPVGGDMEYADQLSVVRALRARQDL
jgi:recombination protein RecR